MGCLPESGGCERQRTDPFVNHLNELEGKRFLHDTCLDHVFRNSPQPEALYIEADTGDRLVIERKPLVWPSDYIVRHKNDHFLADLLLQGLADLTGNAPYGIVLEAGLVGRRDELTQFANRIVDTVRTHFPTVERGRVIGSSKDGRAWKFFREDASVRKADDEPQRGLVIRWYIHQETSNLTINLPDELLVGVSRLFNACILKFRAYLNMRRILVIDEQGELRYSGSLWWAHIFERLPPPPEISEIWTGIHDWITDVDQGWMFEKLYPVCSPQAGMPRLTV